MTQGDNTHADDDIIATIRRKCIRILIVDDEDGFRHSLTIKLQTIYGAFVECADSASMALEIVADGRNFDLIMLDVTMPQMSGIDVYKIIRSRGVEAPVVFMSAHNNSENRATAEALGVALLVKPVQDHALRSILLDCGGESP